jgi:endonuclease YncB( thermonuclease family)
MVHVNTRSVLLSCLLVGSLLSVKGASAADLIGTVESVKDGDDVRVCSEGRCVDIRLCGIDAPERHKEKSGAREALVQLTLGKRVRCVRVGEGSVCDGRSKATSRKRVVAQCFVDQEDVAGVMTKAGHACDWEKFSGGHYRRLGGKAC